MAEKSFFTTKKDKKNPINSIGTITKATPSKKIGKNVVIVLSVLGVLILSAGFALYLFVLSPVLSLMQNVEELKADIESIKVSATNRDLVTLEENLRETEKDIKQLQKDRDAKISWMRDFGPTKSYYADSERFALAGLHLIEAGHSTIGLLKPFADAGGFKVSADQEVEQVSLAEAFASWIAIMPQIANDIDPVLVKLTAAGDELAQVDASKYPESFRGIPLRGTISGAQGFLVQLNDAGPDIKRALTVIPPLLGVGTGEQRYMILMQNDKEIRGTGGFWTYISTFKLVNGLLGSDFSSNGTYNVDFALEPIDAYTDFPDVPLAYNRHLKVERLFARDANISPDLPTAVDQFMYFWNLAQNYNTDFKPVKGVFTIDTVVLEELLTITGPVTLNGVTYNSETVTLELEKIASLALREQANRKKILGDLMEAMLINVFESDKNLWPKLVDKGIDLAKRKHIQAYVLADPEAQALLDKYNFGGRIVDPVVGDYAYLTSTNLGGGKTNTWFVNKTVDHKLEREGTRYVRTVSATFKYGTKGPEYDPFKVRYQDWVRLYVPLGSEIISVDGSEDETGTGTERNKTFFHGYITVAPDETKTITFKYYLPEGVIKDNTYNLYLQKQSGIISELHTINVNGASKNIELDKDAKFSTAL